MNALKALKRVAIASLSSMSTWVTSRKKIARKGQLKKTKLKRTLWSCLRNLLLTPKILSTGKNIVEMSEVNILMIMSVTLFTGIRDGVITRKNSIQTPGTKPWTLADSKRTTFWTFCAT